MGFTVETIANGEVIKTCTRDSAEDAARWVGYAKRHAGFNADTRMIENWTSSIGRMKVGDSMRYSTLTVGDFARVERVS